MTEFVFQITAQITNGRLPRPVAEQIATAISGFDGKRVLVTVKEQKRLRSLKQNSFYQGPFIEAFRLHLLECGQRVSHDDIHAGLRDAHAKNSFTVMLPGDVPFRIPPSTTRLSTTGFEEFLEEIRAEYAGRFGWQLPFPGEGV
jgi:hypothetical protein